MDDRPNSRDSPPDQRDTLTTPGAWGPGAADGEAAPARMLLPGTRFGRRYRIVELLGRGGMGEVYRADDLHLGQPVALKFLPAHLASDPTAVARLRNEVRVARHVSHPNVCRVFDLDDVEGQLFLTMEYVDGEDLASVLRRLGRPTEEKALQIARQLCAGLAAAHHEGVLHRDLKPSNVMIDGKGRVRITDFGLAAFAHDAASQEGREGTPGYMAPEQMDGGHVSARSDLYALGLTLYEIFTGRKAYAAASFEELRRLQRSPPPPPSSLVGSIDPAVEGTILRCLSPDPSARPATALEIAASLPGGDPIAEALAAGETPSPEVVAAAGGVGRMRVGPARLCLAGIVVGLTVLWAAGDVVHLRLPPLDKRPVVLADAARGIAAEVGVPEPEDRAWWVETAGRYLRWFARHETGPDRWDRLADRRPTAYQFYYREGPAALTPANPYNRVTFFDPPSNKIGSTRIVLDGAGRLVFLDVAPAQLDLEGAAIEPRPIDFEPLFRRAELDPADFEEVDPQWTPTHYADTRRAWVGHHPGQVEPEVRIEAAGVAGRPTYFDVVYPFTEPWLQPSGTGSGPGALDVLLFGLELVLAVVLLVAVPWIARRNLRHGSGDRRGAVRLGFTVLAMTLIVGAMMLPPYRIVVGALNVVIPGLAMGLLFAAWTGCAYLAVEPSARRLWPGTLITWSRLLLGRFRDPRVGRDILVGGVVGVAVVLLQGLERVVPTWFDQPTREPFSCRQTDGLAAFAPLFEADVLTWPLMMLLFLTGARFLLRRRWLATAATMVLLVFMDHYWSGADAFGTLAVVAAVVETLIVWGLMLFLLIRFGLFAVVAATFFVFRIQAWPFTIDPSDWFAGTSFALPVLLVALSIAAYGLATSRGGRRERWRTPPTPESAAST